MPHQVNDIPAGPRLSNTSFDKSMCARILDTGLTGLFRENLIEQKFEINSMFRQILAIPADHKPHNLEISSRLEAGSVEKFQAYITDVNTNGSSIIEVPLKKDSGEYAWIRIMSIAEYNKGGQLTGYFGSIRDVSVRKISEEKTRQADEALHQLMEKTNAGFYEIDVQKRQFLGSPIVAKMFGLPELCTLEPGYFKSLVHPDDIAIWDAQVPNPQHANPHPFELRLRNSKGGYFWVEITVNRKWAPDGSLAKLQGLIRDLDSKKRNEIELQATRERFSILTEAVSAAILDVDYRNDIRIANERFYDMFALPADYNYELTDTTSWVYPDDRPVVSDALHSSDALQRGFEIEYRVIRLDQKIIWVRHVRKVMKDNEKIVRSVNSFVDITEQKHAELEIMAAREQEIANIAATQTKDKFFASMAHELRTPLNAISNYAQLMTEDLADTEHADPREIIKDAQKIANASEYLRLLVDNILDMSKVSAGMLDLYYSDSDIVDIVDHVEPIIRPLAERKGLELRINLYDDRKVPIKIDKLRVNQILINLLSNAVKFTTHGHVCLEIKINGRLVDCSIIDTGLGMDSDELQSLFAEFRQASADTATKFGGSGLGLALSRKLARLMSGEIVANSTKGSGSTFSFQFPREPSV